MIRDIHFDSTENTPINSIRRKWSDYFDYFNSEDQIIWQRHNFPLESS